MDSIQADGDDLEDEFSGSVCLEGRALTRLPAQLFQGAHLDSIVQVDLSNNAITSFEDTDANEPAPWATLSSLRNLNLSHNIAYIELEAIFAATSLRVLDLSHMALVHAPVLLDRLPQLEELYLDHNAIYEIPESWSTLPRLTVLDLSFNALSVDSLAIESFARYSSLEELYVSHNSLAQLPEQLTLLPELLILDVSSNQLTELPASIGTMATLEELNIEDNQITVLPASFANLTRLQSLSLRGNKISSPPMLVCIHGAHSIVNYFQQLTLGKAQISGLRTPSLKREKHFAITPVNVNFSGAAPDNSIQYLRNTGCSQDILEFLTVTLGAEGALTKTPSRRRRREDGDAGDADESLSPPSRRALHSVQSLLQPETSSSSSSTLNATPKPSLPLLNLTTATSSSSSSKASARKSMRTTFRIGSLSIDIEQLDGEPEFNNLVTARDGYMISSRYRVDVKERSGLSGMFLEDSENFVNFYERKCYGRDHANFLGTAGPDMPVAVSVVNHHDSGELVGLIRTPAGNRVIYVQQSELDAATRTVKNVRARDILKAVRRKEPSLATATLHAVTQPELHEELLTLERRLMVNGYKFGILNTVAGQEHENELYSNRTITPAFQTFLDFLGERIQLNGWQGYAGGLDTKHDTTGTESYYTTYGNMEIMFHVSALLPFEEQNEQQLSRKRHLGNDIVLIIFSESGLPFDPCTMTSHFNHVFIVVSPFEQEGRTKYRVAVTWKDGVRHFGPGVPPSNAFDLDETFRRWLLTKLLNAERASYSAPSFAPKIQRTRKTLLDGIVDTFLSKKRGSRWLPLGTK